MSSNYFRQTKPVKQTPSLTVKKRSGTDLKVNPNTTKSYRTNSVLKNVPTGDRTNLAVTAHQSGKELSNTSKNSLLCKPFTFRNVDSLHRAVAENQRRLSGLKPSSKVTLVEASEEADIASTSSSRTTTESKIQTVVSFSDVSKTCDEKRKLEYLMGLSRGDEEEEGCKESLKVQPVIDLGETFTGATEATRRAQKYLRVHQVFQLFQFLIAHLLCALSENPIEVLLDTLDKCIIYRAGMGKPPVLYEKKHLERLFYLMDRMRTDFVDRDQYVTGMKTLGICCYNSNPELTDDGMVSKKVFVEEAYENLVSILDDMIRPRHSHGPLRNVQMDAPPGIPQISMPDTSRF